VNVPEKINWTYQLLRLEMTLGRVVAFIGWAHNQQRPRGCFAYVLPTVGQVSFEEQAVSRIKWIDLFLNGVG